MKTIEQFWSEITSNKELFEKLVSVSNEQELEAILKENEVDCTKEQFKEYVFAKAKESGEISDEELSAVSGGWGMIFGAFIDLFKQIFG